MPGEDNKLVAILSGYHGPQRMGELVVIDTTCGWYEPQGIVHRVGHRGEPAGVVVGDNLVGDRWPKYLHPYPLSDKYFLAAVQRDVQSSWSICLVDVLDNFVSLASDSKYDFFEPIPGAAVALHLPRWLSSIRSVFGLTVGRWQMDQAARTRSGRLCGHLHLA